MPLHSDTSRDDRCLIQCGRSGYAYGTGANIPIVSATIPGGSIKPGCRLLFSGQLAKHAPFNAGAGMSIRLRQGANSVVVGQSAGMAATLGSVAFKHEITFSYDLKWAFCDTVNVNIAMLASLVAGTYSTFMAVGNSMPAGKSPRAKSSSIAFATYSAPPTVESRLIDFSQDVICELVANWASTDCIELLHFEVERLSRSSGAQWAALNPTTVYGDSLGEGTGSTANNDWVSKLGKTRKGRAFVNEGLGGQKIKDIVDRAVADSVCGAAWNMVLWAGINDATDDAVAWWDTVKTQIDRLLAFRGAGTRLIICNYHIATHWSEAYKTAARSVNSQLAATYGNLVCDLYGALTSGGETVSSYLSDTIHLNDDGHAVVASTVGAKMDSLGWP